MDWETYRTLYQNYQISLNQTRVLAIVAGEVLKEFPRRIPKSLREPVATGLREFVAALEAALSGVRGATGKAVSQSVETKPVHSHEGEIHSDLLDAVLKMYIAQVMVGASLPEVDFGRLVHSQELVMQFAHLDAFMADSLRSVCHVRPEVLRSDKKIEWATVLSCSGWEELLDQLAERYVFEFGWQPLPRRVEFLNHELGLGLGSWGYDLKVLEEAEKTRHIIVHNGGRASQEYVARTGRSDIPIGEFVPVTAEYTADVCETARLLASELFVEVSKKFFGVKDSEISGVWRLKEAEPPSEDSGV